MSPASSYAERLRAHKKICLLDTETMAAQIFCIVNLPESQSQHDKELIALLRRWENGEEPDAKGKRVLDSYLSPRCCPC
jgi:hypothetical protein